MISDQFWVSWISMKETVIYNYCIKKSNKMLISYFLGLVSLCTLTLLAYERYNIVCSPMAGFKLNVCRSCQGLLLVWLYCLFWAVAPLLGWSSYGPEGVQTSCSLGWEERSWTNYSYLIAYTLMCFLLPTAVIIYCYSNVLVFMRKVGGSLLVHSQWFINKNFTCFITGSL